MPGSYDGPAPRVPVLPITVKVTVWPTVAEDVLAVTLVTLLAAALIVEATRV